MRSAREIAADVEDAYIKHGLVPPEPGSAVPIWRDGDCACGVGALAGGVPDYSRVGVNAPGDLVPKGIADQAVADALATDDWDMLCAFARGFDVWPHPDDLDEYEPERSWFGLGQEVRKIIDERRSLIVAAVEAGREAEELREGEGVLA